MSNKSKSSENAVMNNTEVKEEVNTEAKKKYVLTYPDIICYVCALVLCLVPFTPFMSEMDVDIHAHVHEEVIDYEYENEIVNFIYLNSSFNTDSAQNIVMSILAYFPILVAVMIVVATILKKNGIRYIMMALDVFTAIYWIVVGNKVVAKIFTGELYEPAAGYYMLLGASFIPIIISLIAITKEKNKVNIEEQK